MAIAIDDVVQVVDEQTYLGQTVLNIYYCQALTAMPDSADALEELAVYFNNRIVATVSQLQNTGLLHVSRTLKNITNGLDFYVDTDVIPGANGVAGADQLPSYISAGFQLVRSTLATRNGYKRLSGLSEDQVTGNSFVGDPAVITDIEEFMAGTFIPDGTTDEWSMVIYRHPIDDPVTPAVVNPIASAQFRGLGTQNTRKPGRGI